MTEYHKKAPDGLERFRKVAGKIRLKGPAPSREFLDEDDVTAHDWCLRHALRDRGFLPGGYAFFFTTGEGRFLPGSTDDDPIEETSGYIVTNEGEHYLFWFGWNDNGNCPAITHLKLVQPDPNWMNSTEYREARQEVGLDEGWGS